MVNMQHALNTVFQNSLYVSANQNSDILDGTHRSQSCQSNHVTSTHDLKNWPNKTFNVEIQTNGLLPVLWFILLNSNSQPWWKEVKIWAGLGSLLTDTAITRVTEGENLVYWPIYILLILNKKKKVT